MAFSTTETQRCALQLVLLLLLLLLLPLLPLQSRHWGLLRTFLHLALYSSASHLYAETWLFPRV
jgi:hypothetical protein